MGLDGLPGAPGIPGRDGERVSVILFRGDFVHFIDRNCIDQGEPGEAIGFGGIVSGPRGDPGPSGRPGVSVSDDEKDNFLEIKY